MLDNAYIDPSMDKCFLGTPWVPMLRYCEENLARYIDLMEWYLRFNNHIKVRTYDSR